MNHAMNSAMTNVHHRPPHSRIDEEDDQEPGHMPVEPDQGPVPGGIPTDPEHDRLVDPEA